MPSEWHSCLSTSVSAELNELLSHSLFTLSATCILHGFIFSLKQVTVADNFCYIRELVFLWVNEEKALTD